MGAPPDSVFGRAARFFFLLGRVWACCGRGWIHSLARVRHSTTHTMHVDSEHQTHARGALTCVVVRVCQGGGAALRLARVAGDQFARPVPHVARAPLGARVTSLPAGPQQHRSRQVSGRPSAPTTHERGGGRRDCESRQREDETEQNVLGGNLTVTAEA